MSTHRPRQIPKKRKRILEKERKEMNKNKKISLPCLFLTMMVLALSASPRPLQAYDRQDLIDSTAAIIRVSNMADFLKAVEQSSVGQLWNSKEMKPFLNNQSLAQALKETLLQSVYSDKEKPDNKELSHLLWEGSKLLKDELIVGISPPNQEGKEDLFILAAMDEPSYQKSKTIDERMAELDENMSAPHKQDFQGVDLIRINRTRADKTSESQWEAFYRGTLVSSTSREWVERCIVQLKKELPAAPTGPPMLQLRITDQFIKYMFDPQDQAANEEHTPGEVKQDAPVSPEPSPTDIFNALGLDHLKYISLDLILKPQSMEFQVTIKTKGPTEKGLWTLLTRESVPLNHRLVYVPDDVYSYHVIRLDFNALWNELPEILKSINPQYIQYLNGVTGMFSQMYKIDLSREVFGNLGTLITTFSRMQDLDKQELYAWQVRNPDAMEKLLAKLYGEGTFLAAQLKDHLEILQLHGYKLYSFKTSPIKPADTPGQESTYTGISVVNGALVFGSDKLVRSLIQAASNNKQTISNTLYQLPEYTALMRKVPDDALGYSITDVSQLVQSLLGLINQTRTLRIPETEKEQDKENIQPDPLTEFFNKLRFDRLPPVDFMASFFSKGITYTRFKGNDLLTRGIFQYRERK
jgi:hypothetical protein